MGYHPSLGFDIATCVMIGHMLRSPHRHHHQARARRRGGGGARRGGGAVRWGGGAAAAACASTRSPMPHNLHAVRRTCAPKPVRVSPDSPAPLAAPTQVIEHHHHQDGSGSAVAALAAPDGPRWGSYYFGAGALHEHTVLSIAYVGAAAKHAKGDKHDGRRVLQQTYDRAALADELAVPAAPAWVRLQP
eukprot:1151700-Prymnesium_polylepis.1